MAELGLQKTLDISKSNVYNISCEFRAGVVELADAQASGACGSNTVWVQVPSPALTEKELLRLQ